MLGRDFRGEKYRFGFTLGENINEISGDRNYVDIGERGVDTRLGKLNWRVDPDFSKYPNSSPYIYAANSPIRLIDINGKGAGDPPGFWESFIVSSIKGIASVYTYIDNNPAHAGYSVKPKPITHEQVLAYSINWDQVLNPNYQIQSFAGSTVDMFHGVYNFGQGIYEGDGAKTAQALPAVFSAVGVAYGLKGLNLIQKVSVRSNLAAQFYKNAGYVEKRAESHFDGINFKLPVQTKTLKKGTTIQQWVGENGIGNYYTTLENGTSKNLGIEYDGRTLKQFTLTEDVKVLQSTAADFNGNVGGGTQYFSTELKNKITPVEKK
jgi:hypothetical protein